MYLQTKSRTNLSKCLDSFILKYFVMCLYECKLIFWKKSARKNGRMHIWQWKVQQLLGPWADPKPPAYTVMYLQTKPNEQLKPLIFSDKENGNCFCQNGQNLSYWNRYFVIYPHKFTFKKLKKKYQEKWENAYLIVKNARASRALRWALDPGPWPILCSSLRSPNFTSLAQLRFAMSAKFRKKILPPPSWPNAGSATVLWWSLPSPHRIIIEINSPRNRFSHYVRKW